MAKKLGADLVSFLLNLFWESKYLKYAAPSNYLYLINIDRERERKYREEG